jgi:hypothetical protein
MKTFASMFAVALLAAPAAFAGDANPDALPRIGAVAPAFGLYPFETKASVDDLQDKVELDDYCGMRPGDTRLVLVVFSGAATLTSDLELVDGWRKKFGKNGFVPIVISTDPDAQVVREQIGKSRYLFPILNDSFSIVGSRYGITSAPFSFLLDAGCHTLGLSDKSLSVDAERLGQTIDTLLSGKLGAVE